MRRIAQHACHGLLKVRSIRGQWPFLHSHCGPSKRYAMGQEFSMQRCSFRSLMLRLASPG